MKIHLVRHAQAEGNTGLDWSYLGKTDTKLTKLGEMQAVNIGYNISGRQNNPRAIYTSPRSRAVNTAIPIQEAQKFYPLPLIIKEELEEFNFGEWEGLPVSKLTSLESWKNHFLNPYEYCIPNGECFKDLEARVWPFIESLKEESIVVTHGYIIRFIIVHVLGLPYKNYTKINVCNAKVTCLIKNKDGYEFETINGYY